MTPGQLRTFLAVAETGSVRAAAESLVVSQPAVSAVLASLRRELGVALVEREGRGLRLTRSGVVLAVYAETTARAARRGGERCQGRSGSGSGDATPGGGDYRRGTGRSGDIGRVPQGISTGRHRARSGQPHQDLGAARRPPRRSRRRRATDSRIGAGDAGREAARARRRVGARREPERGRGPRTVTPAELGRRTWLLRESGSGTRATADELLAELGLTPAILTVGSNGAIAESVRVGLGIALLSRDAVAGQLEDGSLVELRAGPLPLRRLWCVVGRSGGEVLPATAALFLSQVSTRGKEGPLPPSFRRTPQVNRLRQRK